MRFIPVPNDRARLITREMAHRLDPFCEAIGVVAYHIAFLPFFLALYPAMWLEYGLRKLVKR